MSTIFSSINRHEPNRKPFYKNSGLFTEHLKSINKIGCKLAKWLNAALCILPRRLQTAFDQQYESHIRRNSARSPHQVWVLNFIYATRDFCCKEHFHWKTASQWRLESWLMGKESWDMTPNESHEAMLIELPKTILPFTFLRKTRQQSKLNTFDIWWMQCINQCTWPWT